ncbi:BFH_collapsed_G0021270.mRNA.1.CDS.1 [Saccharomyces cerevisiae]|nr:BFH_collapsed_G0021270.mRNA.1.CDS.1 [Saccharomyces cerevisiae]
MALFLIFFGRVIPIPNPPKGKLMTVFSAPNYCDSQGNLGGVIHVVPGHGILQAGRIFLTIRIT